MEILSRYTDIINNKSDAVRNTSSQMFIEALNKPAG